jgi:hypothetical protein
MVLNLPVPLWFFLYYLLLFGFPWCKVLGHTFALTETLQDEVHAVMMQSYK